MNGYLLDTNVLVALLWPAHEQHARAVHWFTRTRARRWATCPMTETGFVRVVSNPAFSRDAVTPREAAGLLAANTAAKDHAFWPDEVPFVDAVTFAGARLVGHQQVTDAYLFGLAIRRGGVLATLDQRIAALIDPKSAGHESLELVA
jgi:uncharacterized protein